MLEYRREIVYYVEIDTKKTLRNKKLSGILGENVDIFYIGAGCRVGEVETIDINRAKFWKDKHAAERAASIFKDTIPTIREMNIKDFVKDINPPENDDYVCIRTRKMIKSDSKYLIDKKELLKTYNCSDEYRVPTHWNRWYKCPNCDKRPLVINYTQQESSQTSCGCVLIDGLKFIIYSDNKITLDGFSKYKLNSLLSNWNHWVKTGQELVRGNV